VSQRKRAVLLALATLATPIVVSSQERAVTRPRPRPELRVDYLGRNPDAVHAGLGFNIPVGTYLRVGLVGAGGRSWDDGRSGGSARVDAIARFSFDPFRERRWGLSAGGGLSIRYDNLSPSADPWRALVAIVLDLEGPAKGSFTPALQIGLGGGARFGVLLRGAGGLHR
jgi:hypothetical protein